ncbi:unnamed protein product [Calypogeia fissa]
MAVMMIEGSGNLVIRRSSGMEWRWREERARGRRRWRRNRRSGGGRDELSSKGMGWGGWGRRWEEAVKEFEMEECEDIGLRLWEFEVIEGGKGGEHGSDRIQGQMMKMCSGAIKLCVLGEAMGMKAAGGGWMNSRKAECLTGDKEDI